MWQGHLLTTISAGIRQDLEPDLALLKSLTFTALNHLSCHRFGQRHFFHSVAGSADKVHCMQFVFVREPAGQEAIQGPNVMNQSQLSKDGEDSVDANDINATAAGDYEFVKFVGTDSLFT